MQVSVFIYLGVFNSQCTSNRVPFNQSPVVAFFTTTKLKFVLKQLL